ncbi:hypothetical protein DL96DRAFT_1718009 [Flagelloscypha sp. PMI_526]|nr:hypothetical protein DL96DRAFT_1718009 [Flagelloscypha sp. PMI_526]
MPFRAPITIESRPSTPQPDDSRLELTKGSRRSWTPSCSTVHPCKRCQDKGQQCNRTALRPCRSCGLTKDQQVIDGCTRFQTSRAAALLSEKVKAKEKHSRLSSTPSPKKPCRLGIKLPSSLARASTSSSYQPGQAKLSFTSRAITQAFLRKQLAPRDSPLTLDGPSQTGSSPVPETIQVLESPLSEDASQLPPSPSTTSSSLTMVPSPSYDSLSLPPSSASTPSQHGQCPLPDFVEMGTGQLDGFEFTFKFGEPKADDELNDVPVDDRNGDDDDDDGMDVDLSRTRKFRKRRLKVKVRKA